MGAFFGISITKIIICGIIAAALAGFAWGVYSHIKSIGAGEQLEIDQPQIDMWKGRATGAEGANVSLKADQVILDQRVLACDASVDGLKKDNATLQGRSKAYLDLIAAQSKAYQTEVEQHKDASRRATLATENACNEAKNVLRNLSRRVRELDAAAVTE